MITKIPPHDLDVEKSVLGAMMLEGEAVDKAVDILGTNQNVFYNNKHRIIYEAMMRMYSERTKIDIVTLAA